MLIRIIRAIRRSLYIEFHLRRCLHEKILVSHRLGLAILGWLIRNPRIEHCNARSTGYGIAMLSYPGIDSRFEKILRHAEERLARHGAHGRGEVLDLYREFLKIEEHRLFLAHRSGEEGLETARKRADLMSVVLAHCMEEALRSHAGEEPPKVALMATGGFGRGALCPLSDIDVLFLYEIGNKGAKGAAHEAIERVLYTLWDIGLKVGHASRTLEETLRKGRDDFKICTSLLESRFIAGQRHLYENFVAKFHKACIGGREREYLRWRVENQRERHEKNGGTVFLQEPNIKNGCGGLRDYHNMLWVAQVARNAASTQDLENMGRLAHEERERIDRACDFLHRVRTELHLQPDRAGEVLTLQVQGKVAEALGYRRKSILHAIEDFMRDYYHNARDVYLLCNSVSRVLAGSLAFSQTRWILPAWAKGARSSARFDGLVVEDGCIKLENESLLRDDPLLILKVFSLMQQQRADLSADLETSLRKHAGSIAKRVLWGEKVRELFLDILRHKGDVGRVIRAMHNTSILGRLISEFEPLTCLVQHEFYHRYTADEHTLVCIEQLDKVLDSEQKPFDRYRPLLLEAENTDILYLALILHDVGKAAHSRDHSSASARLAVKFAKRMRIQGRRLRLLSFLVDHHLTLAEFAQRRDLENVRTIIDFARIVEDRERLDHLMLLTFADARAVGDFAWSNWKEGLVWRLYEKTCAIMEDEEEFLSQTQRNREEVKKLVARNLSRHIDENEIAAHFASLPSRYLNHRGPDLIERDIAGVHRFLLEQNSPTAHPLTPVILWENHLSGAFSEVTVVTWDRSRLFANISGAFAVAELNILNADVWTRDDYIVVDAFRVCTPLHECVTLPRDRNLFEQTLARCLQEPDFDLEAEIGRVRNRERPHALGKYIVPPEVGFDNEISESSTALFIRARDRIGLLHDVALCIALENLCILHARITTEKGAAFDTFYIATEEGGKILNQEQRARLFRALIKTLAEPEIENSSVQ
jgi:[protein-PII] uridylyltransferase